LCAVSGGIDSMVMLDLFAKTSIHVEVMHMNYQLRGKNSDADQALVEKICASHKIKCHSQRISKPPNCNTQEWARDQRYAFISRLDHEHQYDFIATAHHKQDQLETILLSIFKGYSLQTIKSVNDKLIRPLLSFDKQEIISYASANGIEYHHDQSNFENEYDRNYLRNQIIPSLRGRFDNFDERVIKFAERQSTLNQLNHHFIDDFITSFSSVEPNNLGNQQHLKIKLDLLQEKDGKKILSLHLKKHYGFNEKQLDDLITSNSPAAQILSKNFLATIEDEHILISENEDNADDDEITIQLENLPFQYNRLELNKSKEINQKKSTELMLDLDKLTFPLRLRKIRSDDTFYAFGLKGKSTSLNKFLREKGLSGVRRRQDYLIEDAQSRLIIPGIEIDYRLKIDNQTETALFIVLQDKS